MICLYFVAFLEFSSNLFILISILIKSSSFLLKTITQDRIWRNLRSQGELIFSQSICRSFVFWLFHQQGVSFNSCILVWTHNYSGVALNGQRKIFEIFTTLGFLKVDRKTIVFIEYLAFSGVRGFSNRCAVFTHCLNDKTPCWSI